MKVGSVEFRVGDVSLETFKRHSDLVSSVAIFALNSCVLAAKASERIPDLLGYGANVALGYVGVISVPAQVHYLDKSWSDVTRAVRDRDGLAIVPVAIKVSNEALNVFLTIGNFAAAVANLVGHSSLATAFYIYCRPLGIAGTVATIFVDLFKWGSNQRLISRLEALEESTDENIQMLFRNLVVGEPSDAPELKLLATAVHRSLDKDTWEALSFRVTRAVDSETLTPELAREMLATVRSYCKRQDDFYKANVGLRALGYVAMAVTRANPDTVIQSATLWGMSLLYTSKLGYQKLSQAEARTKLV